MGYVTGFSELIIGQAARVPNVVQYRIGVLYAPINSVVIQIIAASSSIALFLADDDLRDEALNKIAVAELAGLPLAMLKATVGHGTDATEFALAVDVNDYLQRENPRTSTVEGESGRRLRETIQIDSRNAFLGRTRFFSRPLSRIDPEIRALFDNWSS